MRAARGWSRTGFLGSYQTGAYADGIDDGIIGFANLPQGSSIRSVAIKLHEVDEEARDYIVAAALLDCEIVVRTTANGTVVARGPLVSGSLTNRGNPVTPRLHRFRFTQTGATTVAAGTAVYIEVQSIIDVRLRGIDGYEAASIRELPLYEADLAPAGNVSGTVRVGDTPPLGEAVVAWADDADGSTPDIGDYFTLSGDGQTLTVRRAGNIHVVGDLTGTRATGNAQRTELYVDLRHTRSGVVTTVPASDNSYNRRGSSSDNFTEYHQLFSARLRVQPGDELQIIMTRRGNNAGTPALSGGRLDVSWQAGIVGPAGDVDAQVQDFARENSNGGRTTAPAPKLVGAVASELGDYPLVGEYTTVEYNATTYNAADGISAGQIMFNNASEAAATAFKIVPQPEDATLFLRRLREGVRIDLIGSTGRSVIWSSQVAESGVGIDLLNQPNGRAITVLEAGTRADIAAHGEVAVVLEGQWEDQVDARADLRIAASDTAMGQTASMARRYPQSVRLVGRIPNASLVGGQPPIAPQAGFNDETGPIFIDFPDNPWQLVSQGIPTGTDPVWLAENTFNFDAANNVWGIGTWTYTRQDQAGWMIFAYDDNGLGATDAPANDNWTHFAFRRADGSISPWTHRGQPPIIEELLFYSTQPWNSYSIVLGTAVSPVRLVDDYSAFRVRWRNYNSNYSRVTFFGEAMMTNLDSVYVGSSTGNTYILDGGNILATIGGNQNYASLQTIAGSPPDIGMSGNGCRLGMIMRRGPGVSSTGSRRREMHTMRVFQGYGSGRLELWGIR